MKRKLLYVQWVDALSPTDCGWLGEDYLLEWTSKQLTVEDTGWVLEENKCYLCLVGGKYTDDCEFTPNYHRIVKIPKACILKKIDLTKHIK